MMLRLALLSLLLSAPALAQSGVIAGTVSDASTKQPAAGVVVTASSPSLQGERVVVTDASGQYRIPQLPPGSYSLRIASEPFQPHTRTGILLRVDRTVRVNQELLPYGFTETVAISTHPTIDARGGCGVLSPEFVRQVLAVRSVPRTIAVRSFVSLVELAPRSHRALYAYSSDRATPDVAFVIDGVAELAPEWTHGYPPVLTPTGEPHRLHIYPEELP